MNRSILQMVVRRAEAMAAGPGADAPGDGLLLGRFVRDRDDLAFGTLLARHAPMVWGVCRGLLPCDADAEDAFQATFLARLRGAKSIRETKSIAPWLHGTATRIAKKSRLTNGRRNTRERKSARPESAPLPIGDATWDQAHLVVHEEIAALPSVLRTAFVLCVLEGDRHHDAAAKLGVPIGTVSARVSRARQKLLDRLNARGIAPVAMVSALVAGPSTVPAALLDSVRLSISDGFATAGSAVVHLATTATEGTMMKTKLLAAAVMIAGAIGTTGGSAWINKAGGQAAPPAVAAPTAPRYPVAGEPSFPSAYPPPTPTAATAPVPFAGEPSFPGAYQPPTPSTAPTPVPYSTPLAPSRATWEHLTVTRPNSAKAFQDMLKARSNEGWEYVGSETFDAGDVLVLSVFKRPLRPTYTTTPAHPPASTSPYSPALPPADTPAPRFPTPATPPPAANPLVPSGGSFPRYEVPVAPSPNASPFTPRGNIPSSAERSNIPSPTVTIPETPRANSQTKIVKLKHLAAPDVATVITQYLQAHQPDQKRMGIVAEPVSNSLLITTPDATTMNELVRIIGELDASPKSETKPAALPSTRPAPGTAPKPSSSSPKPSAPPKSSDSVYEVIALKNVAAADVAKNVTDFFNAKKADDSPAVRIVSEPSSNQIVILNADADQLKEIRKLVSQFDDSPKPALPPPTDFVPSGLPALPPAATEEIPPVPSANTEGVTEVVQLRFIAVADAEKSLTAYLKAQPLNELKRIRITSELRTNSMAITGSTQQSVKAILKLVRAMDAAPEGSNDLTSAQKRFQAKVGDSAMIALKHADAVAVAKSIQNAWTNDKRAKDNTVDIAADATSNSIYVASTNPTLLKEFRDKIQESDKQPMPELKAKPSAGLADSPKRTTNAPAKVTVPLSHAIPSRIESAIANFVIQFDPPLPAFALVADDAKKQIVVSGSSDVVGKIEQMIREMDKQLAKPGISNAENRTISSTMALPDGFGIDDVKQVLNDLGKGISTPVEVQQSADGKYLRFRGTSDEYERLKVILRDFGKKPNQETTLKPKQ